MSSLKMKDEKNSDIYSQTSAINFQVFRFLWTHACFHRYLLPARTFMKNELFNSL